MGNMYVRIYRNTWIIFRIKVMCYTDGNESRCLSKGGVRMCNEEYSQLPRVARNGFLKPLIGVSPLFDNSRVSVWMLPRYLDGLKAAGAIPVILPLHIDQSDFEELALHLDGFLMTGGHDVSPLRYGEAPLPECGDWCRNRDALDWKITRWCYSHNLPVLGICRGLHVMNIALGGTLYQDLPSEFDGECIVEHHMQPPYNRPAHDVTIVRGTPLWDICRKETIGVNSYHHQGIRKVAPQLKIMAIAEDGLVEGLYAENKTFFMGVQWHPEFIYQDDPTQLALLKAFVQAAKNQIAAQVKKAE